LGHPHYRKFTGDNACNPKMHPLVSLVAIFGGIEMFGILGIFLGPILAAVLIALLQLWPEVGQRFGLLPGSKGGEFQPRSDRSS
jgi:predicted PurR-regulated permease PerM